MCPFEAWALQPSLITTQDAEARLPQAHRDYNANRVHLDRAGAARRVPQALGKEQ